MKNFMIFTIAFVMMVMGAAAFSNAHASYKDLPAGVYKLDKTHASLTWKVMHLGLSKYTARFTDFDASYTFNPRTSRRKVNSL